MKNFFCLLLFCCRLWPAVPEEIILAGGKNPSACFDGSVLTVLYEAPNGGIAVQKGWEALKAPVLLVMNKNAYEPMVKKDPFHNLWAVWSQGDPDGIQVYLARINGDSLKNIQKISSGLDGNSHSPSLSFSPGGNPWVAWVNDLGTASRVLSWNRQGGEIQEVFTSTGFRNAGPSILVPPSGFPWIIWSCSLEHQPEICISRLDGSDWSEASRLNTDGRFPHIFPQGSLDSYGRPWVVWSEYDGRDYEIAATRWNGRKWMPVTPVTHNEGRADTQPSIRFLPGDVPMIVWTGSGEHSILAGSIFRNGTWSGELCLAEGEGLKRFPHIAAAGTEAVLVWENQGRKGNGIYYRKFSSDSLLFPPAAPGTGYGLHRLFSQSPASGPNNVLPFPGLEQDEFLAIGDSITYGVLSRTWYPDKGYVPRLEHILSGFLGPVSVINSGVPGEFTWEGLARIEETLKKRGSKFAVIMEGTNDMRTSVPAETSAFNIAQMVEICVSLGVYPVVGTIIHRSDDLWEYGIKEKTLLFNDLLRAGIPEYAVPLVDHFQAFDTYPDGYPALFSDGAHPNEKGYQLLAEGWGEAVRLLPWPPEEVKAERKTNQILFYDEPVNVITWNPSPLTDPSISIEKFLIFRKEYGQPVSAYVKLDDVSGGTFSYYDRNIQPDKIYEYCLLAQSTDGIKGFASSGAADR